MAEMSDMKGTSRHSPQTGPPRWVSAILTWTLPRQVRDFILGDLAEIHRELAESVGRRRADRWYLSQALSALHPRHRFSLGVRGRPSSRGAFLANQRSDLRGGDGMKGLCNDLRYGLRMALKSPAFALATVLTLTLGIATSSLMFSGLNTFLLQPLPFRDAGRLVQVWMANPERGWTRAAFSYPDFVDWKRSGIVDGLVAYRTAGYNLNAGEHPQRVTALRSTWGLFQLLGVQPLLGRVFSQAEDRHGAQPTAVVSHRFWRRHLESDPSAIGRTLLLDGASHTIVGVMPEEFWFPDPSVELWMPLAPQKGDYPRGSRSLLVLGRLSPSAELEQAEGGLSSLAAGMAEDFPDSNAGMVKANLDHFAAELFREEMVLSLRILFGAGIFVLLIACVNVTNLLLARSADRRREVAMRAALGAGRRRLIRQLLCESLPLALVSGVLGVLTVRFVIPQLAASIPPSIPRSDELSVDASVVAFSLAASLATVVVFSLAPTWSLVRDDLSLNLAESGRGSSRGGRRSQKALVMVEVALATTLLVGAGLMLKSILNIQNIDMGFDDENLLTMRLTLNHGHTPDEATRAFQRILSGVRESGAEEASFVDALPASRSQRWRLFRIDGRPEDSSGRRNWSTATVIDPEYFRTMRIPLSAGRLFDRRDHADSPPVAIINATMARRYWPDGDPLGERIALLSSSSHSEPAWLRIVGVVGDVRQSGPHRAVAPEVYRPASQQPATSVFLVLRSVVDPTGSVALVRKAVAEASPGLAVFDVRAMKEVMEQRVWGERITANMMAACAAGALFLATVGLYGVLAYFVSTRRREIGIRFAIGAKPSDILGMIIRQGVLLTIAGLAAGTAGGLGLGQVMNSLLFGVAPSDPFTIVPLALFMLAVSLTAGYLPARRAGAVDPVVTLRSE